MLRARDRRTGRIVAVKEALRSSPALLARFAREALVTANLQHPSIVPVYEVGMWGNGEPFYAMKLVAGRSLADALRKAGSLRDRLALLPHLIAVADALAYAHGQRVIHRDLKPANVLLGDFGETVVIDWGLAKKLDERDADEDRDPSATGFGAVMGTPGYMSPEQARGEAVDEQTDVFAIGAMLYEVLSQTRPYSDTDEISAVIDKSGSEAPKSLAELMPEAPRELVAIVERAMAFDAKNRYPSAKELAEDLRRFETGQLVGAHQYTTWQLVRRWFRRHAAIVSAIAIALVVLAIVGAYSVVRVRRERDAAVAAERIAAREKARAEDRAAALAEEQGRRLAMEGDAARALPYLAAAVEAGRSSRALEFVLARALDAVSPVEAVLVGAQGLTHTVSYSPDGSRLVAAGTDDTLRVWDTHSHKLVGTIGRGINAVWSPDGKYIATYAEDGLSFIAPDGKVGGTWKNEVVVSSWLVPSPNGAFVALGTKDGRIVVVQPDGKVVLDAKAHDKQINELEWSPDGEMLAAASDDGVATVWRPALGVRIALLDHSEKLLDLSWSPDGHRIATADAAGHVTSWDLATTKKLFEITGHTNSVEAVDFDPLGQFLVTASADRTAALWDATTGKRLALMPLGANGNDARFSSDGQSIVTSTVHGDLQVWTRQGEQVLTLAGHAATISMFQFSPDGKQLASCGHDGDVRLWRLDTPPTVVTLDNGGAMTWRGEWSPDGKQLAITAFDGVARVYDGNSGQLVRELRGHTGEVTRVAFSPDSTHIATASVDGTVRIWQGETSTVLDAKAQRVRYVAYSHDGKSLATTHDDGTARIWDAVTGKQLVVITPKRGKPRTAVWSPDDKRLVTPLDADGASLWDDKGTLLGEATVAGDFTPAAAWSVDGSQFVLAGGKNLAAVFDGKTAAPRATLVGHNYGPIVGVDTAADGSIVTAAYDGLTRLWRDGKHVRMFGEGTYPMTSALFSPDGKLVVTSDLDARVWDVASGELVGRLPSPRDVENAALTESRWSPDGTRLLVLSLGLPPRLWRVPSWTGSIDALKQRLACTERWKLQSSQLVLTTPNAASCR